MDKYWYEEDLEAEWLKKESQLEKEESSVHVEQDASSVLTHDKLSLGLTPAGFAGYLVGL